MVGSQPTFTVRRGRPATDSLARKTPDNLDRLPAALRELRAFLRVDGLTDDEARGLPTRIDAVMLGSMDISTWRTDAGDGDVLIGLPSRDGGRVTYDDLAGTAVDTASTAPDFGSLRWMQSSPRRSGPIVRRTVRRLANSVASPRNPKVTVVRSRVSSRGARVPWGGAASPCRLARRVRDGHPERVVHERRCPPLEAPLPFSR